MPQARATMIRKTKAELVKELAGRNRALSNAYEERDLLLQEKANGQTMLAAEMKRVADAGSNADKWHAAMTRAQEELNACRSERNDFERQFREQLDYVGHKQARIKELVGRLDIAQNEVSSLRSNNRLLEQQRLLLKAKIAERLLGV